MWNRTVLAAIWTTSLAGCPAAVPVGDEAAGAGGGDAPLGAGDGQEQMPDTAACYHAAGAAGRGTAVLDITGGGYDIHGTYEAHCGRAWLGGGDLDDAGIMFEVCEPTFNLMVGNTDLRVSGNQADPAVDPDWEIIGLVLNDLYVENPGDPSLTKVIFGPKNAAGKIQGATVDAYVSRAWAQGKERAHILATFDCDG